MRPRLVGLAKFCLGLICTIGLCSALRPSDCFGWIQNSTSRVRSESTEYCPAIPYQLIVMSTMNLVHVTSTFQELNDLPLMLRAAENFWDKGPLVDKNSLPAYLSMEHTSVLRVIFANIVHVTDVALSRLENIAVVDSDDHSAGFKMFIYCRESEFLQNYFREILPDINVCKSQVATRIRYVQVLLRQLRRIKASVPKDVLADSLKKNSTVSFQVALPWHHWRTMAEVGRRERKHKLERLDFTAEYFFRAEKKLESIMITLEFIENSLLLRSGQEIEMYWDCRSRISFAPEKGDDERRLLQSYVVKLKMELGKLKKATVKWSKANSNEKGYLRGFAFSLAGIIDDIVR